MQKLLKGSIPLSHYFSTWGSPLQLPSLCSFLCPVDESFDFLDPTAELVMLAGFIPLKLHAIVDEQFSQP
jgi:hypothetical protein